MSDGNPTHIFLRDDDIGELTPELLGFMDIFQAHDLPVSYQIIPADLTRECAAHLRERRAATPALYEFAQHGLTHNMEVGGQTVFYEFGPERTYEQQLGIIQQGQAILQDLMGPDFNREVFTPPQHKYDRNTLKALAASGVKVLSASNYGDAKHRLAYAIGRTFKLSSLRNGGISYHGAVRPDADLLELSITVIVDDAAQRADTTAKVFEAIESARQRTAIVGLMFHHSRYKTDADRAFLTELAERLAKTPNTQFHLLGDVPKVVGRSRVAA